MLDKKVIGAQIHQFNNLQPAPIPRSTFDRSFPIATTHGTDYIIPIMNDEILPGDHIRIKPSLFTRLNPTVRPIMDNLYRDTHAFFIPMRLIWENWEKFQGQQLNPSDSVDYSIPIYDNTKAPLSTTGFAVQSLQDYMEIPPNVSAHSTTRINSYFERAYNLVFNEWYKDENLDTAVPVPTGNGPDDPADFVLLKRRKRKDYRTSALPWPQKGPAASIGLSGTAPVIFSNPVNFSSTTTTLSGSQTTPAGQLYVNSNSGAQGVNRNTTTTPTTFGVTVTGSIPAANLNANAIADLAGATGISLNQFRQLVTLQQMLELDARGGTRYTESLYARWGVIAQDARLQRPELIGESTSPITVYAVPQTSPTSGSNAQGQLAAYGTGIEKSHFEYTAQEHGVLLVLTNVRADLRYSQYLPNKRTRKLRTDFYEPIFANVGEMPVRNYEVKFQGAATDFDVFGYQEAWSSYRWKDAMLTGLMRPYVPGTLAVWNLSQNLGGTPVLNSSFITEAVPMDRVLAVTTEPAFLVEGHIQYIHTRAMPMRSNPGLTRI